MRQMIGFWLPAVFCAFLAYIALSSSDESWRPAFFSFLPMCFFFVGMALMQMHREVRALRDRVAELEARKGS
ncbi:MAG: hypothetical protein ABSH14_16490 [Verrucomicrobiia bacterium]|jgi:hypothetical protein